jgi:glycosyltransferase involved in cell wall biosynthesis
MKKTKLKSTSKSTKRSKVNQKNLKNLKVALVHDYLREYGGAERVVEALHKIFPDAPVYVAFTDSKIAGIHWSKFADWDIRESWLTKIPFYKQLFSPLRFLAPHLFASFDFSDYDLVISSTNAYFSKAIRVPNGTHICYCHTPARSLYGYTTMTNWRSNPITRFFGNLINHYLRIIDFQVAQKVDYFIANSIETQRRIEKFYRRESKVIYPPIELPVKPPKSTQPRSYYLYVGRLAASKHVELAVEACAQLDLPLKVVGEGRGVEYLQSLASEKTEFLGAVSDEKLSELYSGAKALLFPAEDEDFGMVPVEAMGHGTPVIAHRSGGPLESIIEDKTGLFFDQLDVASLVKAIRKFEKMNLDDRQIRQHALKFGKSRFEAEIKEFVKNKIS